MVCCCSKHEIGIDIEQISYIDLTIAESFFTYFEYTYLKRISKQQQMDSFFDLWILKESYIKYKAKGLSMALNSFEFDLEKGNIRLRSNNVNNPYFFRINIDSNYKLALCSEGRKSPNVKFVRILEVWEKLAK